MSEPIDRNRFVANARIAAQEVIALLDDAFEESADDPSGISVNLNWINDGKTADPLEVYCAMAAAGMLGMIYEMERADG